MDVGSFIILIGPMGVVGIANDGSLEEAGEPAQAMRFDDYEEASSAALSLPIINDHAARVVIINTDPKVAEIQVLALMIEYYRALLKEDAWLLEGYLKEHAIKSHGLGMVDDEGNPIPELQYPLQ
jgi:hypothetical protein